MFVELIGFFYIFRQLGLIRRKSIASGNENLGRSKSSKWCA